MTVKTLSNTQLIQAALIEAVKNYDIRSVNLIHSIAAQRKPVNAKQRARLEKIAGL